MKDPIIEAYEESLGVMFGLSDSYSALIEVYRARANDLEESRDYWRNKCEFYETLIKGEVE